MIRRVLAIAALLIAGGCKPRPEVVTLGGERPDQLQQTFWKLPDFSLTERSGKALTLADLKGKVWVADFFYSTCPGPCPMMKSRLSEVHKQLAGDDRVRLVSISTDPAKDTPEVLQQYAAKFGADERWLFATGEKAAIFELALRGFKLPLAENPGATEPIIHSTRLVLVDQSGTVRGTYESVGAEDTASLLRDLRRLLDKPAP